MNLDDSFLTIDGEIFTNRYEKTVVPLAPNAESLS
jgi:hypothetical protein